MNRPSQRISLGVLVAAAFILAHCGSQDGGKGEESPMPEEGSADSWKSPTHHGDLLFGKANQSEFNATQMYHSWTFTLSGPASVMLRVYPHADNFDTVMYLYQQADSTQNWGRYIARNDDHDKYPWSLIEKDLGAGQFKVMLKGYKQSLRGRFDLMAECSGTGCPKVEACDPDTFQSLPDQTGVGASCVEKMLAVLQAPVLSTSRQDISKEDRCLLSGSTQLAWDYYYYYFEDLVGWEDLVYDPEEPFTLEVSAKSFGDAGAFVGVDYGGDEMAMDFLFDGAGNLLMYYQHNQSPDVGWFCKDPGEKSIEEPGEDCAFGFLMHMTSSGEPDPEVRSTVTAKQLPSEPLPELVKYAIGRYQEYTSIDDETSIAYTFTIWTSEEDGQGLRVTVSADGHPEITYYLGSGYRGHLYVTIGPDGTEFTCAEIQ